MARRRRSNDSNESGNDKQTQSHERVGVTKMAGLSPERIAQLLGQTRQKGQYVGLINSFIESGEMGVDAKEQWPELREKQATTLKQGFDNAKDKKEVADGAEAVRVIKNEDSVFLINMAVAGESLGELAGVSES